MGSPESQWKAQYLIFEKLREEAFAKMAAGAAMAPEVTLTVEIRVPSSQVGKIIGKGGANVRELQRVTGAVIKFPEQGSAKGEETPVHMVGAFYSVQVRLFYIVILIVYSKLFHFQSAQRRLRAMIQLHPPASSNFGNNFAGSARQNSDQQAMNGGRLVMNSTGAPQGSSEC